MNKKLLGENYDRNNYEDARESKHPVSDYVSTPIDREDLMKPSNQIFLNYLYELNDFPKSRRRKTIYFIDNYLYKIILWTVFIYTFKEAIIQLVKVAH